MLFFDIESTIYAWLITSVITKGYNNTQDSLTSENITY